MPDTKWTYPDGSSITEHEDGSFTVTEANGAKTHYDDDTGRRAVGHDLPSAMTTTR